MTDAAAFRAQYPVLEHLSYLNAGTEGPIPATVAAAVADRVAYETSHGRIGREYLDTVFDLRDRVRVGYAGVLGADPSDVALTGSTTDGCNTVLGGLDLGPGDRVLTSDEEHPGLLAPLGRLAARGVVVDVAPFATLADAVTPEHRLVACSHVSYVNGQVIDAEALTATGVPFLLDGAQGVGAVPTDVGALGCAFYAGSGQKWLCGPEGSGALFVRRDMLDEVTVPWPWYASLAEPSEALTSGPSDDAARLDHGFAPGSRSAWALASLEVFRDAGWDWVLERAATLAERLAAGLTAAGLEVQPRGRSTLVSWSTGSAQAAEELVTRLLAEDVAVRAIPGDAGLIRASAGAWSSEDELDRLVELVA